MSTHQTTTGLLCSPTSCLVPVGCCLTSAQSHLAPPWSATTHPCLPWPSPCGRCWRSEHRSTRQGLVGSPPPLPQTSLAPRNHHPTRMGSGAEAKPTTCTTTRHMGRGALGDEWRRTTTQRLCIHTRTVSWRLRTTPSECILPVAISVTCAHFNGISDAGWPRASFGNQLVPDVSPAMACTVPSKPQTGTLAQRAGVGEWVGGWVDG